HPAAASEPIVSTKCVFRVLTRLYKLCTPLWVSSARLPRESPLAPPLLKGTPTYLTLHMLLQKTLHMSQPLAECKARLASIQSYRRQFLMVTRATVTSSKTVDFSFRGPLGFEAHTVLLSVESDSPNQYALESVGGNVDPM